MSRRDLSRRGFIGAAGAAGVTAAGLGSAALANAVSPAAAAAAGAGREGSGVGLALVNGRIHTFDDGDRVVSQVLIHDGRFAQVGSIAGAGGRFEVVNLRGRTVIPGLIDNHVHFVRIGQAAGHDMRRLETAFSIDEVQQVVADTAAEVEPGEFLTALRGLARRQWSSPTRHLTRAELDEAAPDHPVVISEGTNGQTNTLGRDRLRALGVTVSDAGAVNDDQAYLAMARFITLETKKRELLRAAEYALSVGLTGFIDEHGNILPEGTAGFLDRITGHDHILDLWRSGQLPVRVRARFGVRDAHSGGTDAPSLIETYAANRWELLGDAMFRQAGIGEWAPRGDNYQYSLRTIASRPIQYQQHLISTAEIQAHLDAVQQFADEHPDVNVADLYWSIGHIDGLTVPQIEHSNRLGIGLIPQGWSYLTGNGPGPDFRSIVDLAEVPVGTGTDGARVAPLNPWTMVYYMTTGRNSGGALVNDGRQISRHEALKLYAGPQQGWFCKEPGLMGGIAEGRYADLAVLSADVFDTRAVPDTKLRTMSAVLTVVDGVVRHDAGVL
ncbi:hypothetical protein E1212_18815 [Jiangella ureilytica]|uniref:Amidohydrolase 3 domain-containing protein n=1 Tax=Jiangella ureilytica TaxID=2530374 RepID=A0A4R4RIA3_9ACTN|nr:amidohydrolase family protein [Jiangella ureilytica]TDC49251.1 hypothetical protein E1212_18815 [Jiangella ureilytica]